MCVGLLGVIAASILEPFFYSPVGSFSVLKVGFIEEFAKILGVLLITRNLRRDFEMDGLILGTAVGMGFAALESSVCAFTAFLMSNGNISADSGSNLNPWYSFPHLGKEPGQQV